MTAQIIQVMFYPMSRLLALLFSLNVDSMTVGSLIISAVIISIVIRLLLGALSHRVSISSVEVERSCRPSEDPVDD